MKNIDEGIKQKCICHNCIEEEYLSNEVLAAGSMSTCDYCDLTAPTCTIDELADRIEAAFAEHYVRTSDQPDWWQATLLGDKESNYTWYRDGDQVDEAIQGAAEIPQQAASDVGEVLSARHYDFESAKMGEESEFDEGSHYEYRHPTSSSWDHEWKVFEESLKREARFFSRAAATHLADVFKDIDKFKTQNAKRPVVRVGPGRSVSSLYRARVFQSKEKLNEALCRPDLHLGSPPASAATAGRMNARGISVFYGAIKREAAIAEVRPPVGSSAVVARFLIVRELRLLDLAALENAVDGGSIFDPTLKRRLERAAFLRTLGERMTRPVMPDDEGLDYLATQAVADFLASENSPALDGIIFRSAQVKGGRNVVLFHKAARVGLLEIPEGTVIDAHASYQDEDGADLEYTVHETPPPTEVSATPAPFDSLLPMPSLPQESWDARRVTLQIDLESVVVHSIEWVHYRTTSHDVSRHRFTSANPTSGPVLTELDF